MGAASSGDSGATTSDIPVAALAIRPPALPSPYQDMSGGALEGGFDSGDVKMPTLKIINGSGELASKFNQGSLVYGNGNDLTRLWGPPDLQDPKVNPIFHFVPIKLKKQWRENLHDDEVKQGLMPRVVSSVEEAESLGGTTAWIGDQKPRWAPSAQCFLYITGFDKNPAFNIPMDGKNWAPAVYYASGSGYNNFVKVLFNCLALREQGKFRLAKFIWSFQVAHIVPGNFGVFVPLIKVTKEPTGPEVLEAVGQFLNQRVTAAASVAE